MSIKNEYDKDMERCFLIGYLQGEKGYLLWRKSTDEIITCGKWDFPEFNREDEEEDEAQAMWDGW